MNPISEKISSIGVVPVIKLNNPERDAADLAAALCKAAELRDSCRLICMTIAS